MGREEVPPGLLNVSLTDLADRFREAPESVTWEVVAQRLDDAVVCGCDEANALRFALDLALDARDAWKAEADRLRASIEALRLRLEAEVRDAG